MAEIGTDIDRAVHLLKKGKLVAIPTETVYGLAGNGLISTVVSEIFKVKNRPSFDPIILHTDSLDKLEGLIVFFPDVLKNLAEVFWPGPLTILLEKTDRIPDLLTSGLQKVAVRIPDHPLTLKLLQALDFPLGAPSANPFGYISPTTAHHVNDQLGEAIPYILDGGQCHIGVESTIIDFIGGEPIVLRQGGIPLESLETAIGQQLKTRTSSSRPLAPGMLDIHYAPKVPLVIEPIDQVLRTFPSESIGHLAFMKAHPSVPVDNQFILSEKGDINEAAQNFFAFLRKLDKLNLAVVVAEYLPEIGLGRAINDKLRRAERRLENLIPS